MDKVGRWGADVCLNGYLETWTLGALGARIKRAGFGFEKFEPSRCHVRSIQTCSASSKNIFLVLRKTFMCAATLIG